MSNPRYVPLLVVEGGHWPTKGSPYAAGWDVYARLDKPVEICPGQTEIIPVGFKVELPEDCAMLILPRSGISTKTYLRIPNAPGLVDPDYRGEVMVALYHAGPPDSEPEIIEPGMRIAQVMIVPYVRVEFLNVKSIGWTERGEGGFGHTGVR